jgi:hypothetical protein
MIDHPRAKTFLPLPAAAIVIAVALATSSGARAHGGHSHAVAPKPTAEELAAFSAAKAAFERHCFRCHTTGGKKSKPKAMSHMSMDGYPFGGHHASEAGAMVRKVLGDRDRKATMPSDDPGSVTGDDLKQILAWADSFDTAHGPVEGR